MPHSYLRWLKCHTLEITYADGSEPDNLRAHAPRALLAWRSATSTTTTGDQRWMELARIIESLSGQVLALDEAGGRESERVGGIEQAIRLIQKAIQNMAQWQGREPRRRQNITGPTHLSENNIVPEASPTKWASSGGPPLYVGSKSQGLRGTFKPVCS